MVAGGGHFAGTRVRKGVCSTSELCGFHGELTRCSERREARAKFRESRRIEAARDRDALIDALHEAGQDLARANFEPPGHARVGHERDRLLPTYGPVDLA